MINVIVPEKVKVLFGEQIAPWKNCPAVYLFFPYLCRFFSPGAPVFSQSPKTHMLGCLVILNWFESEFHFYKKWKTPKEALPDNKTYERQLKIYDNLETLIRARKTLSAGSVYTRQSRNLKTFYKPTISRIQLKIQNKHAAQLDWCASVTSEALGLNSSM